MAANLATIYALQGKKACILDMDFRAPTQHIVFEPKGIKQWLTRGDRRNPLVQHIF
ncbi:MAG: hypothetical protein H5T33_01805 [Candidatus Methanosuratus sp.]|nr:hypothetical protein [Candidatus Methanosuratincola sp.]